MNLATLLDGPANVKHRGETFHFRGGLTLTPLAELFRIETDLYGPISLRSLENSFVLTGTPVGVWKNSQLGVLYRWNNPKNGTLITPRYDVSAVDAATDIVTLVGTDAPRAGCPVLFSVFPGGTLPAGLVDGTLVYWGTSGKVYDTEAHAITDNGTGKIDLTSAGSGDIALIEQEYLQIDAITVNRRVQFHNSAVIDMPPAILSAIASALGQVAFGAFVKNNTAWNTANSVYTVSKVALSDTPPNATQIPTQEYGCAFGAAPWDSFKSRGPITITPKLSTKAVSTDGQGNVGLYIDGLGVTATLQPEGFSHSQMLDLLAIQGGASSARGASKVRGDLVVTGTGVTATLANGAPRELPQTFQTAGPLAGQLGIEGVRTPGSAAFEFAEA